MKIKSVELENFAAVYVGLRLERLKLDFSTFPNIITIIVGDMGSGKTTILSQLHPWPNIGVLDERNSDQLIRSECDGLKHIIFTDGLDTFDITHKYAWSKDHHTIKSSFKYNGEELNPNGNQSSFKELVTKFMGIDQSYLRITRIGPNVSNLIDMPWNQRKSYVASMIHSVDIYAEILAEIKTKMKTCDAELSTLTKQMMNITDKDIDDMIASASELVKTMEDEEKQIVEMSSNIQKTKAISELVLNKYSVGTNTELELLLTDETNKRTMLTSEIDILKDKIDKCGTMIDIKDIMKNVGKENANIDTNKRLRVGLEQQLDINKSKLNTLLTKKKQAEDDMYVRNLNNTYNLLKNELDEINDRIGDKYRYEISSAEISALLSDIKLMDQLFFDVKSSNRNVVNDIIHRTTDPVSFARNQIEKLELKLRSISRFISNMQYISTYDVSSELPEITDATCKECPYYKTHPNIVKAKEGSKINDQIHKKKLEVETIQQKINVLSDYPTVSSRISKARELFSKINSRVAKLGALYYRDFNFIIESDSNSIWYNYDKIVTEMELATMYEKRNVLSPKLDELSSEIKKYSTVDVSALEKEIEECNMLVNDTVYAIKEIDDDIDKSNSEIAKLNALIDDYNHYDELNKKLRGLYADDEKLLKRINEITKDLNMLVDNDNQYIKLSKIYNELESKYTLDTNNHNRLNNEIERLTEGRKNIGILQEQKYVYELIKDASSPQSGIPLIYVQLFLNDCISMTNELISMVLDDSIEIMDLDLSKPDLKIPYRKNGETMDDVKSASQGERAVISLALSFAFMNKCMNMNSGSAMYNILLLDEIDAPFYKDAREKCLGILSQQIKLNNIEQVFFITHNQCYDGFPVNMIATTDTGEERSNIPCIRLY